VQHTRNCTMLSRLLAIVVIIGTSKGADTAQACYSSPTPTCVFGLAIDLIKSLSADNRAFLVRDVVQDLATAGEFDSAMATSRLATNGTVLGDALVAVAEGKASRRDFRGAQETIQKIHDWEASLRKAPNLETDALRRVAEHQVAAGEFDAASRSLSRLLSLERNQMSALIARDNIWGSMAIEQAKLGNFSAAFDAAGHIESVVSKRPETLAEIALAQTRFNQLAAADRTFAEALTAPKSATVRGVTEVSADGGARVLAAIAEALGKANQLDRSKRLFAQALAAARQTKDALNALGAFWDIGKAQARAGDMIAARRTFNEAETRTSSGDGWSWLVTARVAAGDIEGALTTARRIPEPYRKADALLFVAKARAKGGRLSMARQLIREARLAKDDIDIRQATLTVLAAQAATGDAAAALSVAAGIRDVADRARTFSAIASAMGLNKSHVGQ
jgi:tetratricopeptide (TPR) repeat protein